MIDKYEGLKNIYDWLLELIITENDYLKYQTSQYFITSECNFEKYEGVFARVLTNNIYKGNVVLIKYSVSRNNKRDLGYIGE